MQCSGPGSIGWHCGALGTRYGIFPFTISRTIFLFAVTIYGSRPAGQTKSHLFTIHLSPIDKTAGVWLRIQGAIFSAISGTINSAFLSARVLPLAVLKVTELWLFAMIPGRSQTLQYAIRSWPQPESKIHFDTTGTSAVHTEGSATCPDS